MALSNATLLNAVLMKASQTICRIDASFPAKPYVYHERVLQGLIPYLANHGRIQDEATLVAAVLLRGFEEFHGKLRHVRISGIRALTVHSRDPWSAQSINI
jgi:hypothetical protein